MSLEIKIPGDRASTRFVLKTSGEELLIGFEDWSPDRGTHFVGVNFRSRDAARLAGILDAWAEKGYLPEGEEVWG